MQQAKADDGAAELEYGVVHRRQLFPAGAQPPHLVQPADRPLDDPSELAQAAAVIRVAPGDHRLDAARFQLPAVAKLICLPPRSVPEWRFC